MTDTPQALLIRAGALLMDGAGMLRMEAGEWRNRRHMPPPTFVRNYETKMLADKEWADKCERIAKTNEAAATAMLEHAKKLAEATSAGKSAA